MKRHIDVVGIALLLILVSLPRPAAAQAWRCTIDLHQGDVGSAQFTLTGSDLSGSLTVDRNGTPNTTHIAGTWSGETISFTRTLSPATSIQPFRGVALAGGDGSVKMAGRFAAGFEGIWSGTCTSGPGRGGRPDRPTPPIGPEPPRRDEPVASTCSITATATGPRADVASAYAVVVLGPNSRTTTRGRKPFGGGKVRFDNLPDGQYFVFADTKADVAVRLTPPRHTVSCQGQPIEITFEFR